MWRRKFGIKILALRGRIFIPNFLVSPSRPTLDQAAQLLPPASVTASLPRGPVGRSGRAYPSPQPPTPNPHTPHPPPTHPPSTHTHTPCVGPRAPATKPRRTKPPTHNRAPVANSLLHHQSSYGAGFDLKVRGSIRCGLEPQQHNQAKLRPPKHIQATVTNSLWVCGVRWFYNTRRLIRH